MGLSRLFSLGEDFVYDGSLRYQLRPLLYPIQHMVGVVRPLTKLVRRLLGKRRQFILGGL